ncbi:ABC transporter permease subunit [Pseudokineococcus sp. 5B2Z-1]|uniref:ABC transporter permease subunit n=1 Tax=Pseudokineococcus sp. 5B2Z-1 TaxID=3132744 RepID=UPI0030B5E351
MSSTSTVGGGSRGTRRGVAGSQSTGSGGASLPRVVGGEWTKLATLRSTWVLVLVVLVLGIGVATLSGWGVSQALEAAETSGQVPPGGPPGGFQTGPTGQLVPILSSTSLAALLLAVLGGLAVTGEYATGTITATLTAVPRRWPVLLAKALVLLVLAGVVALVVSFAALLLGASFFPEDVRVGLGDDGVLGAVLANAAGMVSLALLGLGVGAVLRSTAGTITLLVALVFVAPPLLPVFGVDWLTTASEHTPVSAALSFAQLDGSAPYGTTAAVLVLVGWAVVPLVAGLVLLQRRDA